MSIELFLTEKNDDCTSLDEREAVGRHYVLKIVYLAFKFQMIHASGLHTKSILDRALQNSNSEKKKLL